MRYKHKGGGDHEFAPMGPGDSATPRVKERKAYSERSSPPNDYPAGAVPTEIGWYDTEHAISRLPGHNRITVCRGRK